MDFNEKQPSEDQLFQWRRLTDGNHHGEVRNQIGRWASSNARDDRIGLLINDCRRKIATIYADAAENGYYEGDDFGVACLLTRMMMQLIACEYGEDTAAKIHKTM